MRCRHAKKSDMDRVCNLLAAEFFHDPIYKFVFSERKNRFDVMKEYFRIYVNLALERGGILLTENDSGVLVYFRPEALEMTPEENARIYDQLNKVCGCDYVRAVTLIEGLDNLQPKDPPHYVIALLAIQSSSRGGTLVKDLFNSLNAILDKEKAPCYAECTRYSTRTLIRRWGYHDTGTSLHIDGFPELYPVWRTPQHIISL
ncbi:hypothetical protein PUG81_04760 [Erwiniaceae bacterium L1_54_6]|nr:hypothetical protein [Erwiniaceae bacterium L1_54_6]